MLLPALCAGSWCVAPAAADVYYVDNTSASCSAAGPGTPSQPYCSITAALGARRDPGTTIVVRPGVYRERVVVPASGASEKPIVIRAEGGPVVIDGADDYSETQKWTPTGGDAWLAESVDWRPGQVFADGVRLAESSEDPSALPAGSFVYAPGTGLYANVGGDNPGWHGAAVGRRLFGFQVTGRSNVIIDGFQVTRCESKGIEVVGSDHVYVRHNTVHLSGSGGIAAENCSAIQVFGNDVTDNNHHGILFRGGVTNSVIGCNDSYGNRHIGVSWATGIYLAGSPGNVIECNRVYDNQDSGCEIQSGSNDCLVRQNRSWSNGDHGFAHLFATGTVNVGNVAWGNANEAFSVEGDATGTRVFNCIAVNRGLNPKTYCLFVDSSSTAGFDADYNLLWSTSGGAPIRFGNVIYATLSAFQTATDEEWNGLAADPKFVDPQNGDFHLAADSPAIDAATSLIPGWPETDAEGRTRADAPGTPNTGAGVIGFGDRGALEYLGGVLAVGGRSTAPGLSLSSPFPNPSRRSVAFTLELPGAADMNWSVFDVLGREVWGEVRALEGGRSELRWPLLDRSGARVPNGIYLVRVKRGEESATMRFVVLQ